MMARGCDRNPSEIHREPQLAALQRLQGRRLDLRGSLRAKHDWEGMESGKAYPVELRKVQVVEFRETGNWNRAAGPGSGSTRNLIVAKLRSRRDPDFGFP
jgi:hypothetical protein